MIRYVFKEPITFRNAKSAKPRVIHEALETIKAENKGVLKPEMVWKAAQRRGHVLHPYFEWNVEKAAQAHWIETARTLIRAVHIVDDERETNVPAFLSVTDKGGASYYTVSEVQTSASLALAVMKQGERDLAAWEQRYKILVDICDIVRTARDRLASRISGGEARPSA
jgi:hypothetical protein